MYDFLAVLTIAFGGYTVDPDCDGTVHTYRLAGFTFATAPYMCYFCGHGMNKNYVEHDFSKSSRALLAFIRRVRGTRKGFKMFFNVLRLLPAKLWLRNPGMFVPVLKAYIKDERQKAGRGLR